MSRKQSSSAPAASYAIAASTGSPASRKLTKLTPLTTRPSFTSRQGMTRTLNMKASGRPRYADHSERLGGVEPPVVKRAARDGALELFRARLRHDPDVLDRREPARRDHRNRDRIGERDG